MYFLLRIFLLWPAIFLIGFLSAQEEIRLIIRVDDMGFSHAANIACMQTLEEGVATSVEVMPVGPWFPEAVQMLAGKNHIDVGLHLALTSEWSNLKWRPLTYSPSLTDSNGYFYSAIWPGGNFPKEKALLSHDWKLEEVEREVRAQIEMTQKHIPWVSHITGHMGVTNMSPEVKALVEKLAGEYGLKFETGAESPQRVSIGGSQRTPEEKMLYLTEQLQHLAPGLHMLVTHPGLDTPELQGVNHKGYDNVAEDRLGDTQTLTDPILRKKLEELKIRLVDYRDL